ncbi:peptidylprolyl isomerase [Oscillatoria salina]|uniref:peptidylprolyl isomerase n=1 Tax=Oscillatoria salina TaxID=331517 RepID=UPI0013BDF365|nr:peptidylprolyl isomerase [Oscillatoria salina]MBZ8180415.1 peptidylprolyl isomerase [Oscillatoria salina IIICB1]NET89031.1 peptidylprolyl isomerase [Kamptonema sp. SIO1D9]
MPLEKLNLFNWCKRLLKTSVTVVLLVALSISLSGAWWNFGSNETARKSSLAQGDAITDPTAILRYALPLDNQTVRDLQRSIEDISTHLRSKRWSPISRDVKEASKILNLNADKLLASINSDRQTDAESLIARMKEKVSQLREAVDSQDLDAVWQQRRAILNELNDLEAMMVTEFPFEVPAEYSHLPQLKGRATVEMETEKGSLTIVVDGYSAPVNAGNFVDLVQRGFYDGMEIMPSQDFIVQTGDPPGPEYGFIDPATGEYRAIPLEVLVKGEDEPLYGMTLEAAGLYLAQPVLPFNAYGAVALARPGNDPNGGSSQFFFFKFDTELTPPGFNLMDGRYSVFGYVVDGAEVIEKLAPGDKIISAKVVKGSDNLVQPQLNS